MNNSGDSKTINWFRITDRMSADDGAANLGGFFQSAAQNGGNRVR